MSECTEVLSLLQLIDHHIETVFIVVLFLLGVQIGMLVIPSIK